MRVSFFCLWKFYLFILDSQPTDGNMSHVRKSEMRENFLEQFTELSI